VAWSDGEPGKRKRAHPFGWRDDELHLVASTLRGTEDEQAISGEIDDPCFGNSRHRVAGELFLAIVCEGGIRDLDYEKDVVSTGVRLAVECRPRFHECEIG